MENIIYRIEIAKATLRGAMEAISSGVLETWEMKEFQLVRQAAVSEIRKWVEIKRAI